MGWLPALQPSSRVQHSLPEGCHKEAEGDGVAENSASAGGERGGGDSAGRSTLPVVLMSKVCNASDFTTGWYQRAQVALGDTTLHYHRKLWEFCFIHGVLDERGLLQDGRRGLGFGVGKEPLAEAFAARGCSIVATDLDESSSVDGGWSERGQHASRLDDLRERSLCSADDFERLVQFEFVDMNAIPTRFRSSFDFTWSSCAFEHLGSIEAGIEFVVRQAACLRPGGVGVHTTEYNLSSNDATLASGITVIFRPRDVDEMVRRLCRKGFLVSFDHTVERDGHENTFIDAPPYTHNPHLRLQLEAYESTSCGIVVERPLHRRWFDRR